ncbi:MAG: hypothetical protein HY514_03200 [Candidatus Aenigmarchaeota archaeon]|nr:hypothetical protein [Candidatus Aenigmarchaeota archaeon]
MPNSDTTVRISKKTKHLLDDVGKEIGSFGDTYDDIIFKVLKKIKKNGDRHD